MELGIIPAMRRTKFTAKGVNQTTASEVTHPLLLCGHWPLNRLSRNQLSGAVFFVYCGPARMKVERRDGEPVEQLIRRFNKGVVTERITKTYREKMHFISKSEQRKEKRRRAERNRRKKMAKSAS